MTCSFFQVLIALLFLLLSAEARTARINSATRIPFESNETFNDKKPPAQKRVMAGEQILSSPYSPETSRRRERFPATLGGRFPATLGGVRKAPVTAVRVIKRAPITARRILGRVSARRLVRTTKRASMGMLPVPVGAGKGQAVHPQVNASLDGARKVSEAALAGPPHIKNNKTSRQRRARGPHIGNESFIAIINPI